MTPGEKQAIADAAKLMLEQLRSDRGKTSYWGRRWLDNHADDDIEVWLESVVEVFGAPPVKVGAIVTRVEQLADLPASTVVVPVQAGYAAAQKSFGDWYLSNDLPSARTHSQIRLPARVVYLPDAEVTS